MNKYLVRWYNGELKTAYNYKEYNDVVEEIKRNCTILTPKDELTFKFSPLVQFPRKKFEQLFDKWSIKRKEYDYLVVPDEFPHVSYYTVYETTKSLYGEIIYGFHHSLGLNVTSPKTITVVGNINIGDSVNDIYQDMGRGIKLITLSELLKHKNCKQSNKLDIDKLLLINKLANSNVREDWGIALSLLENIDYTEYIDELCLLFGDKLYMFNTTWQKFLKNQILESLKGGKYKQKIIEKMYNDKRTIDS